MITRILRNLIVLTVLCGFTGVVQAITIPNPDDTVFADDVNESGLYLYGPAIISIEAFDLVDLLGALAVPPQFAIGAEFGFYYGNDPIPTLIPIFEAEDNFLLSPQIATVDMAGGTVFDVDGVTGVASVQNTFVSQGSVPIGFYLSLSGTPIFTQAILNPGEEELAAVFPLLANPLVNLIVFAIPFNGEILGLGASIVAPLLPSPVPLPGAFGLWLLGLSGLALFRRKIAHNKTDSLLAQAA